MLVGFSRKYTHTHTHTRICTVGNENVTAYVERNDKAAPAHARAFSRRWFPDLHSSASLPFFRRLSHARGPTAPLPLDPATTIGLAKSSTPLISKLIEPLRESVDTRENSRLFPPQLPHFLRFSNYTAHKGFPFERCGFTPGISFLDRVANKRQRLLIPKARSDGRDRGKRLPNWTGPLSLARRRR